MGYHPTLQTHTLIHKGLLPPTTFWAHNHPAKWDPFRTSGSVFLKYWGRWYTSATKSSTVTFISLTYVVHEKEGEVITDLSAVRQYLLFSWDRKKYEGYLNVWVKNKLFRVLSKSRVKRMSFQGWKKWHKSFSDIMSIFNLSFFQLL